MTSFKNFILIRKKETLHFFTTLQFFSKIFGNRFVFQQQNLNTNDEHIFFYHLHFLPENIQFVKIIWGFSFGLMVVVGIHVIVTYIE